VPKKTPPPEGFEVWTFMLRVRSRQIVARDADGRASLKWLMRALELIYAGHDPLKVLGIGRPAGRPENKRQTTHERVLVEETIRRALELGDKRGSLTTAIHEIAAKANVSPETLRSWRKKHPDIEPAVRRLHRMTTIEDLPGRPQIIQFKKKHR